MKLLAFRFGVGCAFLAFAVAAGAAGPSEAGVDWANATEVTVVLTEYRFQPASLVFHPGVAYRLHLENRGRELHEFTAPEFLKSVSLRNPDVLARGGREAVLQPHEEKDIYFVARVPGHYGLFCADHDYYGMIGSIAVE